MESKSQQKQILIIDRQDFWRDLSAQALEDQGFLVQTLASYEYPWDKKNARVIIPDLIILGCPSIGTQEETLIKHILEHKHHLLILCPSLPWHLMRSLFLAGADDVADKPYTPNHIVNVVNEALASMSRDSDRAQSEEAM